MTLTPDEVAAIARGRKPAMQEAIKVAPPTWFNLPAQHGTTIALRASKMVSSYRHRFVNRFSICLSPNGLAVQAYLRSEQ